MTTTTKQLKPKREYVKYIPSNTVKGLYYSVALYGKASQRGETIDVHKFQLPTNDLCYEEVAEWEREDVLKRVAALYNGEGELPNSEKVSWDGVFIQFLSSGKLTLDSMILISDNGRGTTRRTLQNMKREIIFACHREVKRQRP